MITKFNILNGTRIIDINTECDDELIDDINIWDTVKISMSFNTYKYKDKILRRIGSEFEKNITIIPNTNDNFGKVIFKFTMRLFGKRERMVDLYMIAEEPVVSTVDLDKAISIYSPNWLIMSKNTVGILYDRDCKCNSSGNSHPFYHEYNHIPVAINEFVNAGEVILITESKDID